jgi:hypothetical protein
MVQFQKLVPEYYDAVTGMTYDGSGNMLTAVFRVKGDSTGASTTWAIAGTLTMTYDGSSNLATAVRS